MAEDAEQVQPVSEQTPRDTGDEPQIVEAARDKLEQIMLVVDARHELSDVRAWMESQGVNLRGEDLEPSGKGRLDRSPKANWVEKRGGLPDYIDRIAVHLHEKGMSIGHAIAVAIRAAKKMCATGDLNWPGLQNVNPGSKAQACAAVAQWTAMKGGAG